MNDAPIFGDNRAVKDMARPGAVPGQSKPDAVRIAMNQEAVADGEIAPRRIATADNPVDYGTKAIGGAKFTKSVLMLTNAASAVAPLTPVAEFIKRAKALQ